MQSWGHRDCHHWLCPRTRDNQHCQNYCLQSCSLELHSLKNSFSFLFTWQDICFIILSWPCLFTLWQVVNLIQLSSKFELSQGWKRDFMIWVDRLYCHCELIFAMEPFENKLKSFQSVMDSWEKLTTLLELFSASPTLLSNKMPIMAVTTTLLLSLTLSVKFFGKLLIVGKHLFANNLPPCSSNKIANTHVWWHTY